VGGVGGRMWGGGVCECMERGKKRKARWHLEEQHFIFSL